MPYRQSSEIIHGPYEIQILDGEVPDSPDDFDHGNVLFTRRINDLPIFVFPSDRIKAKMLQASSKKIKIKGSVIHNGEATHYRLLTNHGLCIMQGHVGNYYTRPWADFQIYTGNTVPHLVKDQILDIDFNLHCSTV